MPIALCADDYAMTPGVSAGILEALEAGAISATSVMTTSPWWPETAPALRPHAAQADIGLHLNLTLGAPLASMPRLAPDGRLPNIGALMRLSRRRALPQDEIAEEIGRQMDRFVEVAGRAPDHVDGHQHVHVLAGIAPLVLEAIARRNWRCWMRDSGDTLWRILARRSTLKKAIGLAVLSDGFRNRAAGAGLKSNDGFAGFSAFDPAASYARQFAHYLISPGPRHLVMCHPGRIDDALRKLDPVVETREQELRFLLSRDLTRTLDKAAVRLVQLSELP